jgi:ubiquitin-protein ligase/uncharacterized protein YegL
MPIKIVFEGCSYVIPYKPETTVSSIKDTFVTRVGKKMNLDSRDQIDLFWEDNELFDQDSLCDLEIPDNCQLICKKKFKNGEGGYLLHSKEDMTLTLKCLGDSYKTIKVSDDFTLEQLTVMIIRNEGLENKGFFCQLFTDRMPLFYNDTTKLTTLKELGISNNHIIYAYFIKEQLVDQMYKLFSDVHLFYQYSDYWKVNFHGKESPSEQSMSTFICCLHSLRYLMVDMNIFSIAHLLQLLRKKLDFPPAVTSLYRILQSKAMNFEKGLVASTFFLYFRQVLPLNILDADLMHEAPIVFTQILFETDVTCHQQDFYEIVNLLDSSGELIKDPVCLPNNNNNTIWERSYLCGINVEDREGITGQKYDINSLIPIPDVKCLLSILKSTDQNSLDDYIIWNSVTKLSEKEEENRWSNADYQELWKQLTTKDVFKGLCFSDGQDPQERTLAVEETGSTVYLIGYLKGSKQTLNVFDPCLQSGTIKKERLKSGVAFDSLRRPKSKASRKNRQITQIDYILLDVSGSMDSKAFEKGSTTRIEAAKMYFNALVDKLVAFELPHAVGLVCFGENIVEKFKVSTEYEEGLSKVLGAVEANEGYTRLYSAIERCVELILDFEHRNKKWLHKNYKKRIFCLTDGGDNSDSMPTNTASLLQKHKIILDSLMIGNEKKFATLKAISICSGGWSFQVDSTKEGISLYESEAVLIVEERDLKQKEFPEITDMASLKAYENNDRFPYTRKPKLKKPDLSRKALSHEKSVVHVESTDQDLMKKKVVRDKFQLSRSGRMKRIMVDFKKCFEHNLTQYQVFMDENNYSLWKIIYKGETGTPYSGRFWLMYVQFPDDYPLCAPNIRFETPIYHCNINNDGKICHQILSSCWSPLVQMVVVLQNISDMLKEPNFDDALDSVKGALYKDDKEKYLKEAMKWKEMYAFKTIEELKEKYKLE